MRWIWLLTLGCNEQTLVEQQDTAIPTGVMDWWVFEGSPAEVDILFVVDRSCSMDDGGEIQDVISALFSWQVLLSEWPTDWQLGVIPTDATPPLSLIGQMDAATTTIELVQLGAAVTSNDEMGEDGLAAALVAYTELPGFWREGAETIIVFASDEPNQGLSSDAWVWAWEGLGQPIPPVAAVVGRTNSDCYGVEPGVGYLEIADVVVDMCEPETWDRIWRIADPWWAPTAPEFELTLPPIPDTLQVWVDGVEARPRFVAPRSFRLADPPKDGALVLAAYWPLN